MKKISKMKDNCMEVHTALQKDLFLFYINLPLLIEDVNPHKQTKNQTLLLLKISANIPDNQIPTKKQVILLNNIP